MPTRPLTLLWPDQHSRSGGVVLNDTALTDLHLDVLVRAIVGHEAPAGRVAARERFARGVLSRLLSDPEVLRYRQAVLLDLLNRPALRQRLNDVLPALEAIAEHPRGERFKPMVEPSLERVAARLADLELLVDAVATLCDVLLGQTLESDGLRALSSALTEWRATPEFAALEHELPALRAQLSSVRSVTVGVNLGPDLAPESATILELGDTPVQGRRGLLWRLVGGHATDQGLTRLQRGEAGPLGRPNELVRDLRHLLGQVVAPVHSALERFSRVSTDLLCQLGPEIALLIGAANLFDRFGQAGLPVCRPDYVATDQRYAELLDAYDPSLAWEQLADAQHLVTNRVQFDAVGRVWVLTGPNRGGKTTYTRTVGLAHVLFQTGMLVAAREAQLSPADAIFTHFPAREESRLGLGALDVEAERLAAIFGKATPGSLILLNEALAGTSALEALDLARGIVRGLRLLGARAIYVTHLHELASCVDELNATTPGDSVVASLVADSDTGPVNGSTPRRRRTYRIVPGPPRGLSFAAEIAEQHGISYPQLARVLNDRARERLSH